MDRATRLGVGLLAVFLLPLLLIELREVLPSLLLVVLILALLAWWGRSRRDARAQARPTLYRRVPPPSAAAPMDFFPPQGMPQHGGAPLPSRAHQVPAQLIDNPRSALGAEAGEEFPEPTTLWWM